MTKDYKKLIQKCILGDRLSQAQLYRICHKFLLPVSMRYAKYDNDAVDYLNIAFYKILTKLPKYTAEGSFEAWCKRVAIHAIIDEMRRQKRYRDAMSPVPEETLAFFAEKDTDLFDDRMISSEDIFACIQRLSPMAASVFNLYAIDGYKHREIGELLGISDGTSKWHYSQARNRLKEMITKLTASRTKTAI